MGSRTPPIAAVDSRTRSVEAYYPFYPPPVYPEGLERGGYSGFASVPLSRVDERTDKGIVNRRNLRMGEINRYTFGHVLMRTFRMIATGQVESSRANVYENMPNLVQLNTWLYRAAKGYPRNLGLSEKVPTIPNEALNGTNAGKMQPRHQFTRNIFTRRSFATAPSIPAKPQAR